MSYEDDEYGDNSLNLMDLLNDNESDTSSDNSTTNDTTGDRNSDSNIDAYREAEEFKPLTAEEVTTATVREETVEAPAQEAIVSETVVETVSEEDYVVLDKPQRVLVGDPHIITEMTSLEVSDQAYTQQIRDFDDDSIPSDEQGGLITSGKSKRKAKQSAGNKPSVMQHSEAPTGEYSISGFTIKTGAVSQPVFEENDDLDSLKARVMGKNFLAVFAGGQTKLCPISDGIPSISKGDVLVSKYVNGAWQ